MSFLFSGKERHPGALYFVIALSCLLAQSSWGASPSTIAGCPALPADNIWNTPIDTLPLDPHSTDYINSIGATTHIHPDFGSGLWDGGPIGIPYNVVAAGQPKVDVTFDYADESDPGPYPIPEDALIEGGPDASGDRHVIVVDQSTCLAYETWSSYPERSGGWEVGSGAIFDLNSNALRPDGWTSADAAGLPILPGLVRYDEVASREIRHAIRFTAPQTQRAYVWPARHFASNLTSTQYPPMGQRFRLRSDYDVSRFSSDVQVILVAMKKYGMILADNGSAWYVSGVPDERWDNDALVSELGQLKGSDFEAVDVSSLMIDPDSGAAKQSDDSNPYPAISVQPNALDFESLALGTASSPRTITVRNIGTADLQLATISLTGDHPEAFTVSQDACSAQLLSPASHCDVEVVFNPNTAGALEASLEIPSDDPENPIVAVHLQGIGTEGPSIVLLTPNGGEEWKRGSTYSITWACTGQPAANVKIEILQGNKVRRRISAHTSAQPDGPGTVSWRIPARFAPGTYTARISSKAKRGKTTLSDVSDGPFSIVE